MSQSQTSLTLQPWSRSAPESLNLGTVLARMNLERGHFREISEASLQVELATTNGLEQERQSASDTSDSDSEDENEDQDDKVQSGEGKDDAITTREELFKAKFEMLQHIASAEQEVLMGLDFMSLALSGHAAQQNGGRGSETLSPYLKQNVPAGSLGLDRWQRMPRDEEREAEDRRLADNVRMAGLQQSANVLLGAAKGLKRSVEREARYWGQVLSVSEKGWNVCQMPGQRQHRLGVRFGFSESGPEFAKRGIAALNADAEGRVRLDRGVASRPRYLRVLVRREGKVVGASKLPVLEENEADLEPKIRHARDSLFDEELFHEMIRESRTLASKGVRLRGDEIVIPLGSEDSSDGEMIVTLATLQDRIADNCEADTTQKDNNLAQAATLTSRLLLTHAHNTRQAKRSGIPRPLSSQTTTFNTTTSTTTTNPLLLLRPIMSFNNHSLASTALTHYLTNLYRLLNSASLPFSIGTPKFEVHPPVANSPNPIPRIPDFGETLLEVFHWRVSFRLHADVKASVLHLHTPHSDPPRYNFIPGNSGESITTAILPFASTVFSEVLVAVDNALRQTIYRVLLEALEHEVGGDWHFEQRGEVLVRSRDCRGKDIDRCVVKVELRKEGEYLALRVWRAEKEERRCEWLMNEDGEVEGGTLKGLVGVAVDLVQEEGE
ncbi:hypothetical protein MBLNU230_g5350t1 [Neophaeotheca triangularis]